MKRCVLIILALASLALAAVERYPAEDKPEEFANQDGCYLKDFNKVFPYDVPTNADDGSCTQFLCSKSNGETQRFSCGAIAIQDACNVVIETTKSYPDCCPKEECDATTPAPTTPAPTAKAPTTAAPTTAAQTTPSAAAPGSSASAYAKSESGKPPVTQTYASPGASASASAT